MKVVINRRFGGFGLSEKAYQYLGMKWDNYGNCFDISRDDERLVECVEALGAEANGYYASLKVVEIPDGIEWKIVDYDGMETIEEVHRVWC